MQQNGTVVQGYGRILPGMGYFFEMVEVSAIERRGDRRALRAMVDTGSEYTWIPTPVLEALGIARERPMDFVTADGTSLSRDTGFAFLGVNGLQTVDLVVFGDSGDATLLGAHTLEGLNLLVDPVHKRLLPGGLVPGPAPRLVRHSP